MPLFFLISGLFVSRSLKKKSLLTYISGRFQIVFYPLLIWGSLQITLQLLLKNYVNVQRTSSDYLYLLTLPRKIEQFWYLNALFFVGAFYALLKIKLRFKISHQLVLGVLLYLLSVYFKYNDIIWGFLNDVFFYYIFFAIGDLVGNILLKESSETKLIQPSWLWSSIILFIASQTFYTIYYFPIDHNKFRFETEIPFFINILFIIPALSGILFVIQIALILKKTTMLSWLRVLGFHSLYIYLMHLIVIAGVRIILFKFIGFHSVLIVISVAMVLGIVLPILFYNIALRLGAWSLFSLKKPTAELEYYHYRILKKQPLKNPQVH
jgi:fucose 4-O-acetylase-like acetyltransferase